MKVFQVLIIAALAIAGVSAQNGAATTTATTGTTGTGVAGVATSTAASGTGMQHTRLRDDNPVVFFDVAIGDMAAGRLLIEVGAPSILRADVVPRTAENFRRLCTGETKESRTGRHRHYARCPFHRVVKDKFCQSGDYANHDGSGGESTFGHSARRIGPIEEDPTSPRGGKQTEKLILPSTFDDENFILRHTGAGVLSMANAGPDSNTCQFYLHFAP
ncbi:hypothetical protein JM16_009735, partial [Phytophthora kernoviae]